MSGRAYGRTVDLSTYRTPQPLSARFKIAKAFVRFYADRFTRLHPELRGFFRTSKRTTSPERERELYDQVTDYHRRNPEVWRRFERFALEISRAGFASYSADAVMHRVRFATDAGEKVNP